MDADATDSYADGKIKAELGDDPDRTGTYTFGFTLYNRKDEASSFHLRADFFTQALLFQRPGGRQHRFVYGHSHRTSGFPGQLDCRRTER